MESDCIKKWRFVCHKRKCQPYIGNYTDTSLMRYKNVSTPISFYEKYAPGAKLVILKNK